MGDRICIMRDGRLVQSGPPLDVYANPANTFVARFLATPPMNLIPATLQAAAGEALTVVTDSGARLAVPERHIGPYGGHAGRRVILGIRAEDFYETPQKPDWQKMAVRVVAIEALGAENVLIGQIVGSPSQAAKAGADTALEIAARLSRHFTAPVGSTVELHVDPLPMHLFDPESELVIPRPHLTGAMQ